MVDELSIIIPVLNEAKYLPRLLNAIAKQTYKGRLQVIVVDGHSEDKTVEVAESFKSRIGDLLILKANRNAGHQRNVGADKAKYKYLLFLDADVILPANLIEQLAGKIHDEGPFIAGVMHTSEDMNWFDRLFIVLAHFLIFVSWVSGTPATVGDFILTTKENHRRINGFVEGAILGEDTDYGLRSIKAGAKNRFYFEPRIIASARRVREMGRWRLLWLWSRAFLHVLRHGPIFPDQGYEYPFGHYDSHD